jgi:thiol-disulfide isomerase/thioredoxin
MKSFWEKVTKLLADNYWLQPVLLVSLVFVLVFSLQAVPGIVNTVQGWFETNEECEECEFVNYTTVAGEITRSSNTYVLITQKGCAACQAFYPVVDRFLAANPDIRLLVVDIEKIADIYTDPTLTDENIYEFGKLVDVGVTSSNFNTIYNASTDFYDFLTPTLVEFNTNRATKALVGSVDYVTLADFFGRAD